MSWSGKQYKGAARRRKAVKRSEAEDRQRDVLPERSAAYRRRMWASPK